MINVLFDYQIFAFQRYGGISRYCLELCRGIDKTEGFSARIEAPLHINAYLGEDCTYGSGVQVALRESHPRFTVLQKAAVFAFDALASMIRSGRVDIVHETFYYGRYSWGGNGAARVVTVHDMIHERFPGSFSAEDGTARRKRDAVAHADHVICNSNHTRADLLDDLDVAPEKVSTVHLGFSFPADDGSTGTPVLFPYALYVGKRDGYKNFSALAMALGVSGSLRSHLGLVCFGGGAFSESEWAMFDRLGLDRRRIAHAVGDDHELARYYRHAQVFVYPSLYEGFGIPPLEAMYNDCPVVCGEVASLPEVVGAAAEFCLPNEPESIGDAIEQLLTDSIRRADKIAAGRKRAQLFSWEKCAHETAAVYRRLC